MPVILRVLLVVTLSALDGLLTVLEGGLEIEGNPALRWLKGYHGWVYAFWLHKTVGVGACAWVLGRYRPALLWAAMGVLAAVLVIHAIVMGLCWSEGCELGPGA